MNLSRVKMVLFNLGLVFALMLFVPASAAPMPDLALAASITLMPGSGAPASRITISGAGFDRALEGSVHFFWDAYVQGAHPIGMIGPVSNGSFIATATVPPDATEGKHLIIAREMNSGISASASFEVVGKPKKALFIYNADDKSAEAFRLIIQGMGMLPTDIITQKDLPRLDLAVYDLVIAGADTAGWETGQVKRLLQLNKPVLSIGEGGSKLLGEMKLPIGMQNAQSFFGTSITIQDPVNPLFQTPYRFTGSAIDLYKGEALVPAVSMTSPLHRVAEYGRMLEQKDYASLVENSGRFFYWGYARNDLLTDSAMKLLVNALWEILQYNATVDTLILVDYTRMTDIGYSTTDVNALNSKISALVALPSTSSKMTAVVRNLSIQGPATLHTARTNWIYEGVGSVWGINSVTTTNAYVDAIDDYIEQLKQNTYPELKYIIIVGAHEVIPMKARPADDMDTHKESSWGAGLPAGNLNNYLTSLMNTTGPLAPRGHYLTDSIYSDLSYVLNGYGADNELVPELGVGRLVETPVQISTLIDNYMASNGHLAYGNKASIGSDDYLDGAQEAANHLGASTDTSLISTTWVSTDVPPVVNSHNAFVYLAGHGNYNGISPGFKAGASSSNGDTEELNMLPNAAVITSGCHNGVNFGDMRYHAYDPSATNPTTYGEFPERMANKGVGLYFGATGYTWISDSNASSDPAHNGWNEKLATDFIKHLLKDGSASTPGKAFKLAVSDYLSWASFPDYTRRVLAIATIYGFPTYRPPLAMLNHASKVTKYGYSLSVKNLFSGQAGLSAPVPSSQEITLLVDDWSVGEDGVIQIPGAEYSGSGGPILPVISISKLFPPGSTITGISVNEKESLKTEFTNIVPSLTPAVVPEGGSALTMVQPVLTSLAYYPTDPYGSSQSSTLGDGGVNLTLSAWPVQYDAATKTTRVWTKLVLTVSYSVDATSSEVDQDVDGLPDYWEIAYGLNPNDDTGDNGPDGDFDGDGQTNLEEWNDGTDPSNPDSDGDGITDGQEAASGTDPLNPGSKFFYIYLPVVMR